MKKGLYLPVVLTLSCIGLTACQNEEVPDRGTREVRLSVGVTRPAADAATTRTLLSETASADLRCRWSDADEIIVSDGSGIIGRLSVDPASIVENEDGTSYASFAGTLSIPAGLEGKTDFTFIYCGITPTAAVGGVTASYYANQEGTLESLGDYDLLSGRTEVNVAGGTAWTPDMKLERSVAFAHFTAKGIEIPEEGLTVTISGDNLANAATIAYADAKVSVAEGAISVSTDAAGDFYVAFPLADDVTMISPTFTAKAGDATYTCTLPRDIAWTRGEYVRNEAGPGNGIAVDFVSEEPAGPDGTVGPELTVNGKKYKFVTGNLYYNINTDVWSIFDNQLDFVNAGGLGNLTGISSTGLGTTPDEIGLFAWGATGLEDAQKPWFIRRYDYEQTLTGAYWPSTDGQSKNSTIKDLWANDGVYDFGHAYELSGRAADDNRTYLTPSSAIFKALMESSFVQGAIVKVDGREVKGLLCIPGITTLAEAKELIGNIDGVTCLSSMQKVLHNNAGNTLNYKNITITDYNALKALNDAVFFPAADKRNLSSGKVYSSVDNGWYWTSVGATTNSTCLYFNGTSGGFFYNGGSNNSSMGRFNQMAIRLVVEID